MRIRFLGWLTALSTVVGFRLDPAHAEVEGAFQIGVGTDVYTNSTVSFEGETPVSNAAALESEGEIQTTEIGFSADGGVSVQLGYGVSEQLVLGGLIQAGTSSAESDLDVSGLMLEGEQEATSLLLAPKIEYLFLDAGALRPFALGALGYVSASQDDGTREIELSGAQVLLGVGLHWFPAAPVSFDPLLHFSYAWVGGEWDPDAGTTTDLEGNVMTIGLGVSVSGWLR